MKPGKIVSKCDENMKVQKGSPLTHQAEAHRPNFLSVDLRHLRVLNSSVRVLMCVSFSSFTKFKDRGGRGWFYMKLSPLLKLHSWSGKRVAATFHDLIQQLYESELSHNEEARPTNGTTHNFKTALSRYQTSVP